MMLLATTRELASDIGCRDYERVKGTLRAFEKVDLPLNTSPRKLTEGLITSIMLTACAKQTSITNAAEEIGVHAQSTYYHLSKMEREDLEALNEHAKEQVKQMQELGMLQDDDGVYIGFDTTDKGFWGESEEGTLPTQKKAPKAFRWAIATVIDQEENPVIALHPVYEKKDAIKWVRKLLDDVEDLGLPVKGVYLDGEFYQVDIVKEMRERDYQYAIRTPHDGWVDEIITYLRPGMERVVVPHTMQSQGEEIKVQVLFEWNQQEEEWWTICYEGMEKGDAARYLRRWGSETDIRSGKNFLPSTNSVKPDYRYLLMLFAFLLFNCYLIARYWRDETIDGLGMALLSLVREAGRQLATALDLTPPPRVKTTSRVETKQVEEVIPF